MNENRHDYMYDKLELTRVLFDKVFYPTLDKIAEMQADEKTAQKYTKFPSPRYQVYDIMFNEILKAIDDFYIRKDGENND